MAELTTSVTLGNNNARYQLFAGAPGAPPADLLGSPRARITWMFGATITLTAAGSTRTITVTATLPPNFAYYMTFNSVSISVIDDTDDAAHFAALGHGAVTPLSTLAVPRYSLLADGIAVVSPFSANAGSIRVWNAVKPFKGLIFNQAGEAPTVTQVISDNIGDTNAGVLRTTLSFLQYDIDQAISLGANFPIPTRM